MGRETGKGLHHREKKDLFRLLAENTRDLLFQYSIGDPVGFHYVSPSCLHFTGYSPEEFYNDPYIYKRIIHPEDQVPVDFGTHPIEPVVVRLLHRNGQIIWVEILLSKISEPGIGDTIIGTLRDVTERVRTEEQLREREARFRQLADSLPETVFETDNQGILTYLSNNAFKTFGYTNDDLSKKIPFTHLIHPDERKRFEDDLSAMVDNPKSHTTESMGIRKDGTAFPVMIRYTPILQHGDFVGLRGFIMDISAQKETETYLRYLSLHDPLTGLFNRYFFEEKIKEFENNKTFLGIIVADIDGLKIINDTLGHQSGDLLLKNTASVLKKCVRPSDMIARIGGDEFVIFLPDTPVSEVNDVCVRIREETASYNNSQGFYLPLGLSVGWATTVEERCDSVHEVFKRADDRMYLNKIQNRQNTKYSIIDTLLRTIEERDPYSSKHAERLRQLVLDMAPAMNLSSRTVNNLCLFARYHDIGKAGLEERILTKSGRLSAKETLEMQRHCEIGHRIAISSSKLAPIADWILKHHEWWNGRGYPLALREYEIPFECRLLAILHEYDTMVFPRPGQKKYTPQEALRTINKFSGTQFDPSLVKTFINLHNPEKNSISL